MLCFIVLVCFCRFFSHKFISVLSVCFFYFSISVFCFWQALGVFFFSVPLDNLILALAYVWSWSYSMWCDSTRNITFWIFVSWSETLWAVIHFQCYHYWWLYWHQNLLWRKNNIQGYFIRSLVRHTSAG